MLPCAHSLCQGCCESLDWECRRCPLCKERIPNEILPTNFTVIAVIDALKGNGKLAAQSPVGFPLSHSQESISLPVICLPLMHNKNGLQRCTEACHASLSIRRVAFKDLFAAPPRPCCSSQAEPC